MDFYSTALVRNFIRFLIEDNPTDEEIENVPLDIKEKVCSLSDEELLQLVKETQEFISVVKKDEKEIVEKIKSICNKLVSD
ncbi:hypothetical protein [Sulfurisphaera ohwakuensis]|uniref:Uncharacterized protein n=1 Tax=Sulfurisphaera ohwakuensis TaxID=69656 RepID=A0A650CIL1_SULOH|nr:hypothetical protein [Sulfurisphaera ohwakuensis]MBB5253821.1 hypothetical protein [Sulfurisphaera ohwakuensis]QGR17505.1 hypothetical protein D1869_10140 [Sulfurisphaera ohwakuensis]